MINLKELFIFHSREEDLEAEIIIVALLAGAIAIQYARGLL